MDYPGKTIKAGERDGAIVIAVKKQINTLLAISRRSDLKLNANDPVFGPDCTQAVRLFQSQKVDNAGVPLKIDGQVGPLTWEALFGFQSIAKSANAPHRFLEQVLVEAGAAADKPVREVPANSNRGPEVDVYLQSAGARPGLAWCVAFVYYCFNKTATQLGIQNPMVKTAGVLDHWARCVREKGAARILAADAVGDPSVVQPGMVFVIDHGGGLGHSGLIERVVGGRLFTIEGNTDASKTREGGGVYRLTRKVADINKGFIDYSGTV